MQERWRELCQEAEHEHDGERLIHLTQEINRLLDEKWLKLRGPEHGGRGVSSVMQDGNCPRGAITPEDQPELPGVRKRPGRAGIEPSTGTGGE